MEKAFQLEFNGQQVQQQDFGLLGQQSGLADDRVYAELFRLTPYDGSTVAKGILRSGLPVGGGTTLSSTLLYSNSTVESNGPTGTIKVNPFRAFVGSRTAVGTEARNNWRDIRSALSVAEGATANTTTLTVPANSSGSVRVDAVYAAVTVSTDGPSATRKVKDPTSGVVSAESVALYTTASVVVALQTGTPGGTLPTIPADSGGTYYILMAYIVTVDGFGSTSTMPEPLIRYAGSVLGVAEAVGSPTVEPANCHNKLLAAVDITQNGFIPTTCKGGHTLFFHTSQAISGVIDDRDWRNRICRWTAEYFDGTAAPVWDNTSGSSSITELQPSASKYQQSPTGTSANAILNGLGQTFRSDPGSDYTGNGSKKAAVMFVDCTLLPGTDTGKAVIYCDLADGGKLKYHTSGSVPKFVVWVDFSAPFENNYVRH